MTSTLYECAECGKRLVRYGERAPQKDCPGCSRNEWREVTR